MSVNKKTEAEKFEPETIIENPTFYPSTAPKSKVKHKQVFTASIYPPSYSNH